MVISDRYKITPVIRERVRNGNTKWINKLYVGVPEPDFTVILDAGPKRQLDRLLYSENLDKLNYFEAGMDLGIDASITRSFLKYQKIMRKEFAAVAEKNNIPVISTKGLVEEVHESIWEAIQPAIQELIVN